MQLRVLLLTMDILGSIFYIVILIMSVVIHEVAHGFAALKYGDETALHMGRLTLNPLKHIDIMGSIVIPLALILSGTGIVFGWAKPVPYNPNNLTDRRKGTLAVASAGIIVNLCVAVFFGLILRFLPSEFIAVSAILQAVVFINLVLAIFNLVPIPPLDGSKILFSLLPPRFAYYEQIIEQYSIAFLLIFVFFIWRYVAPIIQILYALIVGN